MVAWHRVCTVAELQEGEPLECRIDGTPIGLFRVGVRCHAVHDICTHDYARLSKGWQEGDIVECPLHQAKFNVVTGKCLAPPAERDIATYAVKIEDGEIFVALDAWPDGASED